MSEPKQRLVITGDDLPDLPPAPSVASAAGTANPAAALPSVAGVRPTPLTVTPVSGAAATGGGLRATLPASIIGGLVATVLGWLPSEILTSDDAVTSSLVLSTALWTGIFAAGFGALYSAWDDIMAGVWARVPKSAGLGLVIAGVAGAISGAVAQVLYTEMLESIFQSIDSLEELEHAYHSAEFYFARGIAWGLFGLGVGAAVAAPKRSSRKLVNGLIGGVVGGTIGGLFFHWVGTQIESAALGRLLGLAVVGLCVGAAIGLVEVARRQAWMRIVAGGMAGKEFIVYHASTMVGSSPKCEITLIKDPAIGPFHFRIDEHGGRRSLQVYDGCQVAINGVPVTQHWLRNGDVIQAGSTAIQYSEKALQS